MHGYDFKLIPGPGEQSPVLEMESPQVHIFNMTSVT